MKFLFFALLVSLVSCNSSPSGDSGSVSSGDGLFRVWRGTNGAEVDLRGAELSTSTFFLFESSAGDTCEAMASITGTEEAGAIRVLGYVERSGWEFCFADFSGEYTFAVIDGRLSYFKNGVLVETLR